MTRNMPIKRYIENNMSRNGYIVTGNCTFQMFQIHINKISKDLLQKQMSGGVP